MTRIHHLNCGDLESPFIGKAVCHCLLLEDRQGLALVDTGFGAADVLNPVMRIGQEMIDYFSIKFDLDSTALVQIQKMNFDAKDVKHCIVTHLDFDHIGGLADFPDAEVHISGEEYKNFKKGNPRFLTAQLAHKPKFNIYDQPTHDWFGFAARKLDLNFEAKVFLIPLFGHTLGHCGVAIENNNRCLLYAGDTFFTKEELNTEGHPATLAAAAAAENNSLRLESFKRLKQISKSHKEIAIFCYHDPGGLGIEKIS
jgi:glyoxylase-like metal-dependent hydrolase (beta-lactamase superfamily II)